MELLINKIRTDGGTQTRAGLDLDTLAEYTAVFMSAPDTWPFPRLVVFYDGADYWLADGFHRRRAAAMAGRTAAAVEVFTGTRRDAVLYAAGANADHGLRRKREDVQRAIKLLLADEEWGQWSDRSIAQLVKCDHKTVGAARKAAPAPAASGEIPQIRKFERNGQTHTMQTGNIGSNGSGPVDPGITAYEWLKNYADDKGRTWQDLTENQTWHGSSPCWHTFTRDNPNILKIHLMNARDRLVAERDNKPIPSPISRLYPEPEPLPTVETNTNKPGQWSSVKEMVDACIEANTAATAETAVSPAPALDGDEWYTPAWLIELAHKMLIVIDLDPASCPAAQETVQAGVWYGKDHPLATKGQGSLSINWVLNSGPSWLPCRVWLNPPYSMPLISQFVHKLIEQLQRGFVGEALLLTNNNTETIWWQQAAQAANVYLSFNTRIKFWNHDKQSDSPRQGQTLFYFGPNVGRFADVFEELGAISMCLTGEKAVSGSTETAQSEGEHV